MTTATALRFFSKLSPERKARFLVEFGIELTILGRDSYESGKQSLKNPTLLRSINELQHHLLQHVDAILSDSERCNDNEFMRELLDSEDKNLAHALSSALMRVAGVAKHDFIPHLETV